MMVLSNAERQRRYREKREALARGEMLAAQVRALMLDVLRVASAQGSYLYDADGNECPASDFVTMMNDPKFIKSNGDPKEVLAEMIGHLLGDELPEDDRIVVERARDVMDAAGLRDGAVSR